MLGTPDRWLGTGAIKSRNNHFGTEDFKHLVYTHIFSLQNCAISRQLNEQFITID